MPASGPSGPIPSGRVGAETVFTAGFAMMALGLALLAWAGYGGAAGTGLGAVMGGLGLGAAIVLYNRRHKDNPLSPVLMGICRVLVYVTAGLAVALELPTPLWIGAFLLLCYLIGLTYVAKQETLGEVRNLWPLLFLGAPLVYAVAGALASPTAAVWQRPSSSGSGRAVVPAAPAPGRRAARGGEPDRRHLAARCRADRRRRRCEHRLAGGARLRAHPASAAPRGRDLSAPFDRDADNELFGWADSLQRLWRADRDHAADLVGLEADRHRPAHARQHGDVVQLLDHALDPQPMHGVAGAQVDDHQAAARLGIAPHQLLVQRQPGEGAVLARLGQPDHSEAPVEGEAPAVTRTERHPLEPPTPEVGMAEPAGAESSSHSRPPSPASCQRGECGIERPSSTTSFAATSTSTPPPVRRSRQPSATSERLTAVT